MSGVVGSPTTVMTPREQLGVWKCLAHGHVSCDDHKSSSLKTRTQDKNKAYIQLEPSVSFPFELG